MNRMTEAVCQNSACLRWDKLKDRKSFLAVSWKSANNTHFITVESVFCHQQWAPGDLARNPIHRFLGFFLTFENNFKQVF